MAATTRLDVKTLCEITGTRYYQNNEDINMHPEEEVRVYDENDGLIGTMKFGEALS